MKSKRALALTVVLILGLIATIPIYVPTLARERIPCTPTVVDAIEPVDPLDPIGSLWHEVSPEPSNIYKLLSWVDHDGNSELSPLDQIDMKLWNMDWDWAEGWEEWYLVVDLIGNPITTLVLEPKIHWKISLAQKNANAWFSGVLTDEYGVPISGTEFLLDCSGDQIEEPPWYGGDLVWYGEPYSNWAVVGFVHTKVFTEHNPSDILGEVAIDWDGDLTPDVFIPIDEDFVTLPWHLQIEGPGFPYQEVVMEVSEEPEPLQFQLTLKTDSVPQIPAISLFPVSPLVVIGGVLTKNAVPIEGTEFQIQNYIEFDFEGVVNMIPTSMQCVTFEPPFCTVPNDIHLEVYVDFDAPPDQQFDEVDIVDDIITQFPWTWKKTIPEGIFAGLEIEVELEEVQVHRVYTMGGVTKSYGQLGTASAWPMEFVQSTVEPGDIANLPVPFATRQHYLTTGAIQNDEVVTQANPITGIVKIGVPAASYQGLDHTYYSPRWGTYFRVRTIMLEQGCGYIFTGSGKNPVYGDVDYDVYNNDTGVYNMADDQFISAPNIPIPACIGNREWLNYVDPSMPAQWVSGPDEIPGTGDIYDIFGDGIPDPAGSSLLYLPTILAVSIWMGDYWGPLFISPWPQVLTTGSASDVVIEADSLINGATWSGSGSPVQFLASGTADWTSTYKDYKAGVITDYVACWSCLEVPTALDPLDVMYVMTAHNVRADSAFLRWGDANENKMLDGLDYGAFGATWGKMDEKFGIANATDYHWYKGPDMLWNTVDDDRQMGTFDARFDFNNNGMIDGLDYGTFGANWNLPMIDP